MAAAKRFATHTAKENPNKRILMHSKNTTNANKRAEKALREYLLENEQDTKFEDLDAPALAEILGQVYLDARKVGGERYKANSLQSVRALAQYGLY
jgi:hypothetical protein